MLKKPIGRRKRDTALRRGSTEAQTRDFSGATVADRHDYFTNAAVDIDLRPIQPVPTFDETSAELGMAVNRPHDRQANLPAMRVPREHEIDSARRRPANASRVVAQQNLGIAGGNMEHGRRQVRGSPPDVIHANDPKGGGPGPQRIVGIPEDANALGLERAGDLLRVNMKVMIAEDRKDTQPSPQLAKRSRHRLDVSRRKRDKVAGDGDHVRAQAVRQLDCTLHLFARRIKAVMNVREVHDAETVMRWSEAGQEDIDLGDFRIGKERR